MLLARTESPKYDALLTGSSGTREVRSIDDHLEPLATLSYERVEGVGSEKVKWRNVNASAWQSAAAKL